MSDEWWAYTKLDKDYKHSVVKHKRKEYVRGDVYTNTIEGAWSHLKRSMMGTYHRPSKEHLSKYCAEFEFTYNTRKKTAHPTNPVEGCADANPKTVLPNDT